VMVAILPLKLHQHNLSTYISLVIDIGSKCFHAGLTFLDS
jgi:hypothetical protein